MKNNLTKKPDHIEPIAIIGLACRVPGAENTAEFWQLLSNGVDAITEIPADRWEVEAFYDPNPAVPGKMNVRQGGFLKQVDQFDPLFFGISPREAVHMDPQQRLMLELSWEALADAGLVVDKLKESPTGVFFGASWSDYATLHHRDGTDYIAQHTATGTHFSIIANRVSYVFGFRGPSMAIDTACSSSLVAVHQACQSLRSGESGLALAGGVHLMLAPDSTILMSKFGGLAADGRCKTFDARADGYGRGEGGGVVVLKPLAKALADEDPIYGVIRGSAVNNDGPSTGLSAMQRIVAAVRGIRTAKSEGSGAGLSAPSSQAQEALLRAAYSQAGLTPDQVHYVEAFGAGSALGDPTEAKVLGTVFGQARAADRPLAIGSVKTNIGHLEAASGVVALIKVVLSMKHRLIPPHLHLEQPNPNIPFEKLNIKVQQSLAAWPNENEPALAGVSSFGFGGTNCHVVLAEPPQPAPPVAETVSGAAQLFPLSAKTPEALRDYAAAMLSWLKDRPEIPLADLGYTASLRTSHHEQRLALVAHSNAELGEQLAAFLQGQPHFGFTAGQKQTGIGPEPVFVFSDQDPASTVGHELLAQEPVFRAVIEECDQLLSQHAGWSLLAELRADKANKKGTALARREQPEIAQLLLFAWQVGVAALWRSWGIEPGAVIGYGAGEVAAAHVSGSLSLADAIRVIYQRGRLLQANGSAEMARLESLQSAFIQALSGIFPQSALVPMFSASSGDLVDSQNFDAAYWVRSIGQPARFEAAIAALIKEGYDVFLELAPQPLLAGSISEYVSRLDRSATVLPALGQSLPERASLLSSLGALYTLGYPVNWQQLYPAGGRFVRLPAYPWQRQRYWLDTKGHLDPAKIFQRGSPARTGPGFPGRRLRSPLIKREIVFESQFSLDTFPFLDDHRLYGTVVVPGAAFMSMILAAAKQVFEAETCLIQDITFSQAIILPQDETLRSVQLILNPEDSGQIAFQLFSQADDAHSSESPWTLHATGQLVLEPPELADSSRTRLPLEKVKNRCPEEMAGSDFYSQYAGLGYNLGPRFQWIRHIWRRANETLGRVQLPEAVDDAATYRLHPGLIDACIQIVGTAFPAGGLAYIIEGGDLYIPLSIDGFRYYGRADRRLWCQARLQPGHDLNAEIFVADIGLYDEEGQLVAEFEGLSLKRAPRQVLLRATQNYRSDHPVEIEPELRQRLAAASSDDRQRLIFDHVYRQVRQVLGMDAAQRLNPQQEFLELGMDSLMTLELQNRLQASLERPLPKTLAFEYPTVEALVTYLGQQPLAVEPASVPKTKPQEEEPVSLLDRLEQLSDEEVEALLLQELPKD